MIPTKVDDVMKCFECGEILDTCSNCFIILEEGERILCDNEKTGSHYCLKCKQ